MNVLHLKKLVAILFNNMKSLQPRRKCVRASLFFPYCSSPSYLRLPCARLSSRHPDLHLDVSSTRNLSSTCHQIISCTRAD